MADPSKRLGLDRPARYKIRVQGELEQDWSDWFDQMTITCQPGLTIISGIVVDQPALYGVLLKLRDLGLPLISVCCVEPNVDPASCHRPEGPGHCGPGRGRAEN